MIDPGQIKYTSCRYCGAKWIINDNITEAFLCDGEEKWPCNECVDYLVGLGIRCIC